MVDEGLIHGRSTICPRSGKMVETGGLSVNIMETAPMSKAGFVMEQVVLSLAESALTKKKAERDYG